VKFFIIALFTILTTYNANAAGQFEFYYGSETGNFYVKEIDTELDADIDAAINKFGFTFEQFFTGTQKYHISFLSKSISYSNSNAEFSDNDLSESDVKLAWAYASGNFQFDIGIIQRSYFYFEVVSNSLVEFNSDKLRTPFINIAYVFEMWGYYWGLEAFYHPESESEQSNKVSSLNYQFNVYKQFGGVRFGLNYLVVQNDITTDQLEINRNSQGLGLELIFLF
tara:strand:+ start:35514 stop:36185 length:672 start_codon:yes stop_codon:yes gene_type:complete